MSKIIAAAILLLFMQYSFAQVSLGPKAGINLANVKGIGSENNQARVGFYAGVWTRIPLEANLGIQPELLYSVKGYKSPASQYATEATVSFNYINLPLLLTYTASKNLTVLLGPELGFLTSANSKYDSRQSDLYQIFRHFDLGADVGTAYTIKEGFGIDIRYNYGFNDLANVVYTDANGTIISHGKAGANRVFQAGIYYTLK